jgi:beta-glucosidase
MSEQNLLFPGEFIWGAATASYQIEGAWNEDGKTESIWDRFSHTPGKVQNGDTGDIACDHYHRWQDDVALMRDLGLKAYRFSIAWTRVMDVDHGKPIQAGLDFYNRLVDELLKAGIEPFVTLYHWDLPQRIQDENGWASRAVVDYFCEYTQLVSRSLGDRVTHWITLNEPHVCAFHGYYEGWHAPGHKDFHEALAASHHLLLSHGSAVPIIRANSKDSRVGISLDLHPVVPASPSLADRRAARLHEGRLNGWFLDPVVGRGYPQDVIQADNLRLDFVHPGDMQRIGAPIDFLGINYYMRDIIRAENVDEAENLPREVLRNSEVTEMNWEVYPEGMFEILEQLHTDYDFSAIYITENGAAFKDHLNEIGQVNDPQRLDYIRRHLLQVHRAVEHGIPVKGYFVWSLLDNFEWAFGFSKRFGLVYVDFATQKRILKSSAKWYAQVIRANGMNVE